MLGTCGAGMEGRRGKKGKKAVGKGWKGGKVVKYGYNVEVKCRDGGREALTRGGRSQECWRNGTKGGKGKDEREESD